MSFKPTSGEKPIFALFAKTQIGTLKLNGFT